MKDEDWLADTVSIWFVALNDLEITESEFTQAKRKSLSLEWPPTAPFDFLKLSRQDGKSSEYPDTRKAYEHAVDYSGRLFDDREDWRHVVIHETAYRIGFTKLAISPERFTWGIWCDVYAKVCDEHKTGAEFVLPIDKSRQLAHEHTPVQAGTAFDAGLDKFFAKYGSKAKEQA